MSREWNSASYVGFTGIMSSLWASGDWQEAEQDVTQQGSENTYLSTMTAGSNRLLMFAVEDYLTLWKMVFTFKQVAPSSEVNRQWYHTVRASASFIFWLCLSQCCWGMDVRWWRQLCLTFLHLLLQFDGVRWLLLDVCSGFLILWKTNTHMQWVRQHFWLCRSVCVCLLARLHTFGVIFVQLTGHFFPFLHLQLQWSDETFWQSSERKEVKSFNHCVQNLKLFLKDESISQYNTYIN